MSDARLRELQRRWQRSGTAADRLAYLTERKRLGLLPAERLEAAAALGSVVATQLLGRSLELDLPRARWFRSMREQPCLVRLPDPPAEVLLRVGVSLLDALLTEYEKPRPESGEALRWLLDFLREHLRRRDADSLRLAFAPLRDPHFEASPGGWSLQLGGLNGSIREVLRELIEEPMEALALRLDLRPPTWPEEFEADGSPPPALGAANLRGPAASCVEHLGRTRAALLLDAGLSPWLLEGEV